MNDISGCNELFVVGVQQDQISLIVEVHEFAAGTLTDVDFFGARGVVPGSQDRQSLLVRAGIVGKFLVSTRQALLLRDLLKDVHRLETRLAAFNDLRLKHLGLVFRRVGDPDRHRLGEVDHVDLWGR
jgi:hypothetical protein